MDFRRIPVYRWAVLALRRTKGHRMKMKKMIAIALGSLLLVAATATPAMAKKHKKHHKKHEKTQKNDDGKKA